MLLTIASAFFYTEIKSGTFMKMLSEIMKIIWIKWELAGMVLLSLCLQFVLLVFGNRCRFRGHKAPYVAIIVWLTYLGADWIATVALSTLLRAEEKELNSQLVVFWTPFLLLHLGGPHTISAYSLSDNELWLRSLLGLLIQVGVAVYVYMRFRTKSTLTYMAIVIFIAGIIKYGERIWILRAASGKQFSNSIISAPARSLNHPMADSQTVDHGDETLDEYLERKEVIKEGEIIHKAFCLYRMFMPLFADLKLRIHKDLTRIIPLQSMSPEYAFEVVEIELGFLYDVLYTKTTILQSIVGVILRSICLLSTFSALIAFSIIVGKSGYPKVDIVITYMLLSGAIFLDVFSAILHVLSNWTMLALTVPDNKVHKFVSSQTASWLIGHRGRNRIASMAQHSVIDYCLKATSWWTKIVRFIDTEDILVKFWWTTWDPVNLDLKKFIYSSLQKKWEEYRKHGFEYQGLVDLLASKGKSVLKRKRIFEDFKWCIEEVEFNHSLLLWHIATFLLFHDDRKRFSGSVLGSYCQVSKHLSDYMMHLLLVRPQMLPKGIGEVRIRGTREEALRFFNERTSLTESEAASALLHVNFNLGVTYRSEDLDPVQSKSVLLGKSVLPGGCQLASMLQALVEEMQWDHEEKWEMIADVWMEMLEFAASKCRWRQHAMQLKDGGELLTRVALLMAHFGLSEQIREPLTHTLGWDWDKLSHLDYYLA